MTNEKKRYIYFWSYFIVGYVLPLLYYIVKLGVTKTKTSTTLVMPVLLILVVGVIKLSSVIPEWVKTWKPSFIKGIIASIPIYLITIILITCGLVIKTIMEKQITIAFNYYFEFILVFFGALCISSVLKALHLKYRQLDLIDKGYVLGTINNP